MGPLELAFYVAIAWGIKAIADGGVEVYALLSRLRASRHPQG